MTDSVVFEVLSAGNGFSVGVATLNVEKKLNSLTQDMVGLLTETLLRWQQDDGIACVWLQGAGEKAFCAGGDVRCLRDQIEEVGATQAQPFVQAFFENEYRLVYLIHCYAKPIICWGHGIVMGGGIGLMSGASHRVVTETTRMAMPEITIGLYPDVGGTWFLNHAPGRTGLFLGLTGANFNAADALYVGMADRFVPSSRKQVVMDALLGQNWTDSPRENSALISKVLRGHEDRANLPQGNVREHYDLIQAATDGDSCAEVVSGILALEPTVEDKWLQKAIQTLKAGCPMTAHLVFEQLLRGKKLSLPEVFQMELIMSLQCALHHDFPEGVRALLVDKDGLPHWQHKSVVDVTPESVAEHFVPPWASGVNPLQDLE